jgi:hypothetical protein
MLERIPGIYFWQYYELIIKRNAAMCALVMLAACVLACVLLYTCPYIL